MIQRLIVRWKSSASSSRWLNRQENDFFTREAKVKNYKSRAAFKLLQIDDRYKLFNKKSTTNVLDLGAAPGAWNQVALDRCKKGSTIVGVDILPYDPPIGVTSIQGNILSKMTHQLIRETFLFAQLDKRRSELMGTDGKVQLEDPLTGEIELITDTSVIDQVQQTPVSKGYSSKIEEEIKQIEEVMNKLSISKKVLPEGYQNELLSSFDISTNEHRYPLDVIVSDMMANTTGVAIKDHAMSIDLCDAALITAIDLLKKDGSLVMKFFSGSHDKILEGRLRRAFKKVARFKPTACRQESKELYFVCLGKRDYELDKVEVFSAPAVR